MSEEIKETIETVEEETMLMSLEEEVVGVLNTFLQQEQGNKVTQFNMQGLSQILLAVITKER
jgi:hypothetical protein